MGSLAATSITTVTLRSPPKPGTTVDLADLLLSLERWAGSVFNWV